MKRLFLLVLPLAILAACASQAPYDEQFCVVPVNRPIGLDLSIASCHAWTIGTPRHAPR